MELFEYLEQPKSLEQLYGIVQEASIPWNEDQIKLYMMLHSDYVLGEYGRWVRKTDERHTRILQIVDKVMAGKRGSANISKNIMPELPDDLITSPAEVAAIAVKSGRYESPREDVLRYKK